MHWFYYVLCFFAGTAITSGVPHFVKGICGEPFPATPAKPSAKRWPSPIVNVLDGIFDFIIGGALFVGGHVSSAHPATIIVFIAGVIFVSVLFSHRFGKLRPAAATGSPKTP